MADTTADTTWSRHAKSLCNSRSPAGLLVMMAVSIFLVEMVVMGTIHLLPFTEEPEGFAEGLLDSLLLILLLSPMLYYFLFRPLLLHISERKRAEEALEAERNRLETVTENMGAGLALISRDYRTQWANSIIKNIFGDVVGKACFSAYNRQDEVCPHCGVREVFEQGKEKVIHEQKGADSGGRIVWSQLIATPVKDAAGDVTGALELVVPITERKQTEEALRLERNKLKGILDAMPDGVYTVNRDNDIQYSNPVLEKWFGPRDGRKCYEYFYDRSDACAWCKNEEVFGGKSVRWVMRAAKTGRTYDLFDTPIRNEDGGVSKLTFVHDLTERLEAERALKESEKQLRHLSSQLLSAQEQERRRISRELHDELGQSLTLMKLQLRSIEERLRPDQGVLRGECDHTLRYLDQVIDDIRRLSRDLSPAVLEHRGLTAALHGLLANFAKPHGIEAVFDDGGVDLDGLFPRDDRTLLYRIVQEALTNVGKHAGARNVSVVVTRHDRMVSFLIADDGRGFDVKRETAKAYAERGLGLYAMEERARMLGGLLEVWSEEGGGTSIAFSVPAERRASSHEALSHSTGR